MFSYYIMVKKTRRLIRRSKRRKIKTRTGGRKTRKRRGGGRNKVGGYFKDIKTKNFDVRKVELSHSTDNELKSADIHDLYYTPIDSKGTHKKVDVYNAIFDFANNNTKNIGDLHEGAHTRYYAEAVTNDALIRIKKGSHIMITPTISFTDYEELNQKQGKKGYGSYFIGLEVGTGGQANVDSYAYTGFPIAIKLAKYLERLVEKSKKNSEVSWICCPVGVPGHSVSIFIYKRSNGDYELYWADPNGIANMTTVFGERCNHAKLLFKRACDKVTSLTFKHDLLCILSPQGGNAISYFHSGGFCSGYTWMLIFMIIINPTIKPEILHKYMNHRVNEWKQMGASSSSTQPVAAPKLVAAPKPAPKPAAKPAATGANSCYACADDIYHPDAGKVGATSITGKAVSAHRMKIADQCNSTYANKDKEHCNRKGYNDKGTGKPGQDAVCKWGPRPPCALGELAQSGGDSKYMEYIRKLIAVAPASIKALKIMNHVFKDWGNVTGRDAINTERDWKEFTYILSDEIHWNKESVTAKEASNFRDKMIDITKDDTPLNWFETHIIIYLSFVKEYIGEKLYGIATHFTQDILDNNVWKKNIPYYDHNKIKNAGGIIKSELQPDDKFLSRCGITKQKYEDSLNFALM